MLQYIPSKDMRNYLNKINFRFSDSEKATIIYNSNTCLQKIHEELMQITKTTENAVLRKQIEERLAWDLNSIKMLKMNQGGFFYALDVFDTWDNEYENEGYYTTFEMAKLTAEKFARKYIITKSKLYNKEMEPENGDINPEIGAIAFNAAGELDYFWSEAVAKKEWAANRIERKSRFEEHYIPFPHPFHRGDIVKNLLTEEVGIIADIPVLEEDDINDDNNGLLDHLLFCKDYSDASIRIEFLLEDGQFRHDHVLPIYLEYANLDEQDCRRQLMESARDLMLGEGSIELFQMYSRMQSEDEKTKNSMVEYSLSQC